MTTIKEYKVRRHLITEVIVKASSNKEAIGIALDIGEATGDIIKSTIKAKLIKSH